MQNNRYKRWLVWSLADSLCEQKRYADAIAYLDTRIAGNPDNADLWLYQANAYGGLNQWVKAAVNFEVVDQMGKAEAKHLCMLADIYVNEELFTIAVDVYFRALEKDRTFTADRAIQAAQVLAIRGAFEDTRRLIQGLETALGDEMGDKKRKDMLKLRARITVAEGSGQDEA